METQKSDEDGVKSELPPEPEDLNSWVEGLGADGEAAATKLQSKCRQKQAKKRVSVVRKHKEEDDASRVVQSAWRRKQSRNRLGAKKAAKQHKEEDDASRVVQSAWRKKQARARPAGSEPIAEQEEQANQALTKEDDASRVVQSAWRKKQSRLQAQRSSVSESQPESPLTLDAKFPEFADDTADLTSPVSLGDYQSPEKKINSDILPHNFTLELDNIVQDCLSNGTLYDDWEFPATEQSLYVDPAKPPSYAESVAWRRADKLREAIIFPDNRPCSDCRVGVLKNIWLAGAASIVSCRPDIIANNFHSIQYFRDAGVVTVRLFREGRWRVIAVDTRLPYETTGTSDGLKYGECAENEELWYPFLEKAFAKCAGSYEALKEGNVGDTLVDLTGGCLETYELAPADSIKWKTIKGWFTRGSIMCVIGAEEGTARDGIIPNHPYGILDMVEIDDMSLLRIRNPWAQEWKGAMGAQDQLWRKQDLKETLQYEFGGDGTFWMRFEDFCVFQRLHVCIMFPSTYHQKSIAACWRDSSAAGAPLPMPEKRLTPDGLTPDPDPKFFLNPQFRLTTSRTSSHIYVSLIQSSQGQMLLVKGKSRLWDLNENDVVARTENDVVTGSQREITLECTLNTAQHGNHFILICYQNAAKPDPKESTFYLRTFASDELCVEQLAPPHVTSLDGAWRDVSAGGPRLTSSKSSRENPSWCKNPQFVVESAKSNTLKIVLERQVRKRPAGTGLCGFTLVRMQHVDADTPLHKSMHQRQHAEKQAQEALQGQMAQVSRRLVVRPNDWVCDTSFTADDVACMTLRIPHGFGPLMIIPSLSEEGVCGNFSLTVYSERALKHSACLEEDRYQVVCGQWTTENSGGCHLFSPQFEGKNPTWMQNTLFHVTVEGVEHARAIFTLTRPLDRRWLSMIAKDPVGCMVGLYLIDGTASRENVIAETTFVPTNEVTLEAQLSPGKTYSIMPCTYEVGKVGNFILGVYCDAEFTLD